MERRIGGSLSRMNLDERTLLSTLRVLGEITKVTTPEQA
jgi:hypothetical protein